MTVIDMPCDDVAAIVVPTVVLAVVVPTVLLVMPTIMPCHVLVVALSNVLYRRVSSCIVVHTAVFAVIATGNLRTVICRSSVGIMVAAAAIKERIP
ncbi:hypothetical protein BJ875DRAFT_474871 [Amylocarpus encephaloides]|uniref:Uncharacterized protein n=1 Tax=Amylocarpus encephaloides TaxID=45428 RepID=A0A9P8C107_9HELO|nr:hypothetical protein BJ875DRAFT_474871 [Amylocarpus encephaloides]